MARKANPETDFSVDVEGVGRFTFARRTMRDEIDIQREYSRLLDGVQPTPWFDALSNWISHLRVLTVRAPDGWSIDALDPLNDDDYVKLKDVYSAMTEQERSFRRKPAAAGQGSGA